MPPSFRYILRYQIDPAFHPEQRIEELVRFCQDSRIAEVMLFVTPEELSTGHPTDQEISSYIAMGMNLRSALDRAGIALSLIPWTTSYHLPRGRRLREDQRFTQMVGENGFVSPITACPLCDAWQTWLCQSFSRLVQTLQPTVLWVEDDWRLHNHGSELGWGGCFCALHLARFGQAVNRSVRREELLAAVLAEGAPHPWRKIWLKVWRDSLLEPARRLRDAVRSASPRTRLGLMSSIPDVHSIEGRDWHAMQRALGDEPAFLIRPHLPPYTATRALSTPPAVTRQTIANLRRPVEIYPELENSPRCGQYAKSHAYSAWECLHSAAFGSRGITINHYDMMGNGIALDPTFGRMLHRMKDQLDAIAALNIDDDRSHGLQVLFSPEVASVFHGSGEHNFGALNNRSDTWSTASYILGISHRFTTSIPSTRSRGPVAVSGQTLRAFADDDIHQLLSGPAVIDGSSAKVLLERGFGHLIGIIHGGWQGLEEAAYAYESIVEDDPRRFGLVNPRMTAQRCATRLLAMRAADPGDVRTWIRRADHHDLFPGLIVHRNAFGGRIATLAYPFDGQHQFFMGFFNVFRRRLLHDLLFELAPDAPLAVAESHLLHLYRVATSAGSCLILLNPLHDVVERPVIRVPHGSINLRSLQLLNAQGRWVPFAVQLDTDGKSDRLTLPVTMNTLEGCVLLDPQAG